MNNTGSIVLNTGTFSITSATYNHNTGSTITGTGNLTNAGTMNLNIDPGDSIVSYIWKYRKHRWDW